MHITELPENLLDELKDHIEYHPDGFITTKKRRVEICHNVLFRGVDFTVGDTKTTIGRRRGSKTKYGWKFSFTFKNKQRLACPVREMVWLLNGGIFDLKQKVAPIDGDLFNDKFENLKLVSNNNGRPPKARDLNKRSRRSETGLTKKERIKFRTLRLNGYALSRIAQEMDMSISRVKVEYKELIKRKDLKPQINSALVKDLKDYSESVTYLSKDKKDCGIYLIFAFSHDSKNTLSKGYIGSSVCVQRRLRDHIRLLKNNKHYNKSIQEAFSSGSYTFRYYLLEECKEGDLLDKESYYLNKWCPSSLFNRWKPPLDEDIIPFLDKTVHKLTTDKYTVTETGCWEWKKLHVNGYGKDILVNFNGAKKHVKPHRVSYYSYYGTYPKLVRHKCDNPKCMNPLHLEEGSHRQNCQDKDKDLKKLFEQTWVALEGDLQKLSDLFDFKIGRTANWERKMGLREKYPEIFKNCNRKIPDPEASKKKRLREEKKRLREEKKLERQKLVDSHKEEIIKLRLRGWANNKEIAKLFNLKTHEVSKALKNTPRSSHDFLWKENVLDKILAVGWNRGISVPYETEAESIVSEMIELSPEYEEHIKHLMADKLYPEEWEKREKEIRKIRIEAISVHT